VHGLPLVTKSLRGQTLPCSSAASRYQPRSSVEFVVGGVERKFVVLSLRARHSVALELGERGIDLGDVQGWLGHKHVTTTRKHPERVSSDRLFGPRPRARDHAPWKGSGSPPRFRSGTGMCRSAARQSSRSEARRRDDEDKRGRSTGVLGSSLARNFCPRPSAGLTSWCLPPVCRPRNRAR
jgi:hypothetical protein